MRPKLFLALPTYGGMDAQFVYSLLTMLCQLGRRNPKPFDVQVEFTIGDSLVSRARNQLAARFLRSDCTHLLFLDTDLIFSLEQIERLVSHNMPLVAGLYPKKQAKLEWVCNPLDGEEPDSHGLQKVRYAGTGCMLIKRQVFDSMRNAWPEIQYEPDAGFTEEGWDFFSVGVHQGPDGKRRHLSEDWYFCQRCLDLGFAVRMDCRVILKHVGTAVYPLQDPRWDDDKVTNYPWNYTWEAHEFSPIYWMKSPNIPTPEVQEDDGFEKHYQDVCSKCITKDSLRAFWQAAKQQTGGTK